MLWWGGIIFLFLGFFATTLLVNILKRVFFLFVLIGVVLISLALCADAVIGNVQEKAMKLHNGSNSEMVNTTFAILEEHVLS